jgi:hypothetical protein
MHRIKKAIDTLKSYLGKDTHGVGLLTKVGEIANSLRRQVAVAEEKSSDAISLRVAAEDALRCQRDDNRQLKLQLEQQESINKQNEWSINESIRQLAELRKTHEIEGSPVQDKSRLRMFLRSSLRSLLKYYGTCPPIKGVVKHKSSSHSVEHYGIYELGVLIDSTRGDELRRLGRFVSVMALYGYPCIIESTVQFNSTSPTESDTDEAMTDLLMSWIGPNVDWDVKGNLWGSQVIIAKNRYFDPLHEETTEAPWAVDKRKKSSG